MTQHCSWLALSNPPPPRKAPLEWLACEHVDECVKLVIVGLTLCDAHNCIALTLVEHEAVMEFHTVVLTKGSPHILSTGRRSCGLTASSGASRRSQAARCTALSPWAHSRGLRQEEANNTNNKRPGGTSRWPWC